MPQMRQKAITMSPRCVSFSARGKVSSGWCAADRGTRLPWTEKDPLDIIRDDSDVNDHQENCDRNSIEFAQEKVLSVKIILPRGVMFQ